MMRSSFDTKSMAVEMQKEKTPIEVPEDLAQT